MQDTEIRPIDGNGHVPENSTPSPIADAVALAVEVGRLQGERDSIRAEYLAEVRALRESVDTLTDLVRRLGER